MLKVADTKAVFDLVSTIVVNRDGTMRVCQRKDNPLPSEDFRQAIVSVLPKECKPISLSLISPMLHSDSRGKGKNCVRVVFDTVKASRSVALALRDALAQHGGPQQSYFRPKQIT